MRGTDLFSVAFGLGQLMRSYDAAIITGLLGLPWGVIYLRRGVGHRPDRVEQPLQPD